MVGWNVGCVGVFWFGDVGGGVFCVGLFVLWLCVVKCWYFGNMDGDIGCVGVWYVVVICVVDYFECGYIKGVSMFGVEIVCF